MNGPKSPSAHHFTNAQRARLRELETLDADGAPLTMADYAELNALLVAEDAAFMAECAG